MLRCIFIILYVLLGNFGWHPNSYAQDNANVKPLWVKASKAPNRTGKRCYLGIASSAISREKALDESYKSALIELVRKEFPELIKISERSQESLKIQDNFSNRNTDYQSEKVQFFGLEEDQESPFVEASSNGGFDTYRALCWSTGAVEVERKRQAEAAQALTALPSNRFEDILPEGATGAVGKLEIITVPAGASIDFASTPLGRSNASFEKVVAGQYEIVIQKKGYEIKSESVVINAGKTTKIFVELQKIQSTTKIVSQPSGARIYVDNKPYIIPTTPAEISDDVGKNIEVRLEMDDYKTERRTIEISYGAKTETIPMTLLPGKVSIRSTPEKAVVFVDNEKQKGTTPIYLKLPGGTHSLSVRLPGFEDDTREIEVKSSKPLSIISKLTPVMQAENIPSAPSNSVSAYDPYDYNKKLNSTTYSNEPTSNMSERKRNGWLWTGGTAITSMGLAAVAVYYQQQSEKSYKDYKSAKTIDTTVKYRKDTENYQELRNECIGYSGLSALLGILFFTITVTME